MSSTVPIPEIDLQRSRPAGTRRAASVPAVRTRAREIDAGGDGWRREPAVLGVGALVIGLGAAALLGGSGGSPATGVGRRAWATATKSVEEPGSTVDRALDERRRRRFRGQADANASPSTFEHDIARRVAIAFSSPLTVRAAPTELVK